MRKQRTAVASGRNKRRGLMKLECVECPASLYLTWAQAEVHGLPRCACGGAFEPTDFELALALGLVESAAAVAYHAAVGSAVHGQAARAQKWGFVDKHGEPWRTPEQIASASVEKDRADSALTARLGALLPVPEPLPF